MKRLFFGVFAVLIAFFGISKSEEINKSHIEVASGEEEPGVMH
jgi:hypothetical protein